MVLGVSTRHTPSHLVNHSRNRRELLASIFEANHISFTFIRRTVKANMDGGREGTELTQINRRRSSCGQPERTRPPPLRTMSEASVYRANSRQRISVKSGYTQDNKTLDRLMECFWTCSPGCHETS